MRIIWAFLFCATLFSCQSNGTARSESSTNPNLSDIYTDDVVKITTENIVVRGRQELEQYLKTSSPGWTDYNTLFSVEAQTNPLVEYEIGHFKSSRSEYKTLLIRKQIEDEKKIQFEVIIPTSPHSSIQETIAQRRQDWMTHCNAHEVEQLVNQVYGDPTFYFNRGSVIDNRDELIQEYDYMNRDDYNLTLTPLHFEPVSSSYAIEIGQCSGTYGGKYILIWKKVDGVWKVWIDSNI